MVVDRGVHIDLVLSHQTDTLERVSRVSVAQTGRDRDRERVPERLRRGGGVTVILVLKT